MYVCIQHSITVATMSLFQFGFSNKRSKKKRKVESEKELAQTKRNVKGMNFENFLFNLHLIFRILRKLSNQVNFV